MCYNRFVIKKRGKMANNDYLNFCSYGDLKKYAKENDIFDSKTVRLFHDDYIRNLQDDNFNEEYYLYKKYDKKNIRALISQRSNYFAGIDLLFNEGKISQKQASEERNKLINLTEKENKEISAFLQAYHGDLYSDDNRVLKQKISNVELNFKKMRYIIQKNVEANANPLLVLNENKPLDIFTKTNDFIKKHNISIAPMKIEVEGDEEKKYYNSALKDAKYVEWLYDLKNSIKEVELGDDEGKKEEREKKLIAKKDFVIEFETRQVKQLENERKHDLRLIQEKIKKTFWFTKKRADLKEKLEATKKTYTEKEDELHAKIRKNRVVLYDRLKKDRKIRQELEGMSPKLKKRQARKNKKSIIETLPTLQNSRTQPLLIAGLPELEKRKGIYTSRLNENRILYELLDATNRELQETPTRTKN
ncbi:MAG: hypothetical protein Ta2D_01350 [Rickettsiales bacterium]|nr:MAG: hypothetical protein Ta2D_01350 [Rickettsiales bacterium]